MLVAKLSNERSDSTKMFLRLHESLLFRAFTILLSISSFFLFLNSGVPGWVLNFYLRTTYPMHPISGLIVPIMEGIVFSFLIGISVGHFMKHPKMVSKNLVKSK